MSGPTTEAGRMLVKYFGPFTGNLIDALGEQTAGVEAEARRAALDEAITAMTYFDAPHAGNRATQALDEAAAILRGRGGYGWTDALARIEAALAAEAETPDRMSPTVGGKYPEAACHHDAQWLERYTDRAIRAYRQQHPDLLNLASPETAEALARALMEVDPPSELSLVFCRPFADAILAAWRQSLDSPEVR